MLLWVYVKKEIMKTKKYVIWPSIGLLSMCACFYFVFYYIFSSGIYFFKLFTINISSIFYTTGKHSRGMLLSQFPVDMFSQLSSVAKIFSMKDFSLTCSCFITAALTMSQVSWLLCITKSITEFILINVCGDNNMEMM